jgi:hypothetical protein
MDSMMALDHPQGSTDVLSLVFFAFFLDHLHVLSPLGQLFFSDVELELLVHFSDEALLFFGLFCPRFFPRIWLDRSSHGFFLPMESLILS